MNKPKETKSYLLFSRGESTNLRKKNPVGATAEQKV